MEHVISQESFERLKNAYKTKAAEKGFTFDKEWEEAVQKATSNAK